ncbi:MAG: glutamate racemase [Desulfobacterales bacterium]|nr:MAG: glutamate racemase [Desulfobacterales bacterium]
MIGIVDSGIGGLTVVKAIRELMPHYDLLYFGDTARTPYGPKSAATITQFAVQNIEFLLNQGAGLIVVACHTAAAVAGDAVLEKCGIPLIDIVSPAAELALRTSRSLHLGVIGTQATVQSRAYPRKVAALNPKARVFTSACPLLVPLVEAGWLKKPETVMIVKKYLYPLKVRQIDTLILGCTHYALLAGMIQRKIGRQVKIIDAAHAVAHAVRKFLETHPEVDGQLPRQGDLKLMVSDVTDQCQKIAGIIMQKKVKLESIRH